MTKNPHKMTSIKAIMTGVDKGTILQRIFNALCEHPYGMTTSELMQILYGADADGGPDSDHGIAVHRIHFNTQAEKAGAPFRIHCRIGGPGHRYQIWLRRVR